MEETKRPINTLFMLMSLDGKINSGDSDELDVDRDWCKIVYYENIELTKMMEDLKSDYNIERITIQSGGTLNCEFLRKNLIDYVNIVIAPILVGGATTNTLIDGKAISKVEELNQLKSLELLETHALQNSYIQLKYKVLNVQ